MMLVFIIQLTNLMFKPKCPANMPGTDLISIDILRGRDFGLPPYTTIRRLCGFPCVNEFDDLKDTIEPRVSAAYHITVLLQSFSPYSCTGIFDQPSVQAY